MKSVVRCGMEFESLSITHPETVKKTDTFPIPLHLLSVVQAAKDVANLVEKGEGVPGVHPGDGRPRRCSIRMVVTMLMTLFSNSTFGGNKIAFSTMLKAAGSFFSRNPYVFFKHNLKVKQP